MKATELAKKMTEIAKDYKTSYIWGGIGQPITDTSIQAAIDQYTENLTYAPAARKLVGKKAFAFDCVGVIKSILWGWSGNSGKQLGGAKYGSNGVPDISANQMIAKCSGQSTNFSTIQVGELLWCQGHVGIYIGDGLGVECTPRWDGNVQITAVGNIGSKAGYNTRQWTKHGKLPYVTYDASTGSTAAQKQPSASGKVDPALYFNKAYSKTYTVTATALNMRKGAGVTKGIIKVLKKGDKVNCYGYYNKNGSTVWLYAVDSKTGKIGYVSTKYLK